MRHSSLIILLFLTIIQPAFAVETMKSITIYDGLAGESVYKIFKSRWGVMWIATTNGINSYDGFQTKTYRIGKLRSKNVINDIAQSEDGFIWTATPDGLYKVDGTKEWMIRALPQVKGNVAAIKTLGEQIFAGAEDGLYVGSMIGTRDELRHIWLNRNHVQGNNRVQDMCFAPIPKGKKAPSALWVLGNYELYLYNIATRKVLSMNISNRLPAMSNSFRNMVVCGNRIFIGTYNDGIFVYDITTKQISPYINVGCQVITCLSADSNNLYVGTDGAGLAIVSLKDDSIIECFSTSQESRYTLKDNTVYAFYHDASGVNFFGYFRQGLHHNYYVRPLFHTYKIPGFDSEGKNIRSLCIDGNVKVLGSRGGLYFIDEAKGIVKFFSPEELGGSIVTNVVEYDGQYYCSTFNGGVMRIDPHTMTTSRFGHNEALRTSSFGSLKVSPDNELWMAGYAGVIVYNSKTGAERHYNSSNSQLHEGYCNSLLFDRQGRCWISTAKGLCIYDPLDRKIHAEGFPEGFFNHVPKSIGALGDKENLFFYSLDGLYSTNEEMTQFQKIQRDEEDTRTYLSQVVYDSRHHNYWIAAENGMYSCDAKFEDVRKYASEAGLNSREFSGDAIYIEKESNRLWTGTMNGLYYADLDDVERYDMGNARIVLDDVTLNNCPVGDRDIVSIIRENAIRIAYHWGAATLSFMPVLLNYCNQEELNFEYRLGEDGEWIAQRGHDKITIEHLSMGLTTMQIRQAGSKHATEYHLYVFPSALFIFEIIAFIVVSVLLFFLVRQRMMVIRQREEMERVQRELNEAKKKYSRVNTNDDEQQRLFRRLEDYMKRDKPYLNSELKLSDVASHLECSTVKLSQLFSTLVKKNYYDYINLYRLEDFKQRLNDKRYANFTLLALAEECGFKRSSFFSTFKKVEGVTPTEYAKKVK